MAHHELIGEPAYNTVGQPQLVKDRPDLISVVFCGERVIMNRNDYAAIKAIANGPRRYYEGD